MSQRAWPGYGQEAAKLGIKRGDQPARSPDLNVLDLYVWCVLEAGVHRRRPKTLSHRVVNGYSGGMGRGSDCRQAGVRISPVDSNDEPHQRKEWWKQLQLTPHWPQKGDERRWVGYLSVRFALSAQRRSGVSEGHFGALVCVRSHESFV